MTQVAYDPNNTVQQSFLSALALGETGNSSYAANEGFGGVDLTNAPTDQFGFPTQDPGSNVSSAAGTFQFLQGTWDEVAQQLNLTDFSQSNQNEAAWYYAQQTYSANTGGRSLYDDLASGNYSNLDAALSRAWPSVMGNASAPGGLAASLAGGQGANIPFPALPPVRLVEQERLKQRRPEARQEVS